MAIKIVLFNNSIDIDIYKKQNYIFYNFCIVCLLGILFIWLLKPVGREVVCFNTSLNIYI